MRLELGLATTKTRQVLKYVRSARDTNYRLRFSLTGPRINFQAFKWYLLFVLKTKPWTNWCDWLNSYCVTFVERCRYQNHVLPCLQAVNLGFVACRSGNLLVTNTGAATSSGRLSLPVCDFPQMILGEEETVPAMIICIMNLYEHYNSGFQENHMRFKKKQCPLNISKTKKAVQPQPSLFVCIFEMDMTIRRD